MSVESLVSEPWSVSNVPYVQPIRWSEEVEEAYRFHIAGYRDEQQYKSDRGAYKVDRWPSNGFVKKLQRRDGCFFYYDQVRECPDQEVGRVWARMKVYDQQKSLTPVQLVVKAKRQGKKRRSTG